MCFFLASLGNSLNLQFAELTVRCSGVVHQISRHYSLRLIRARSMLGKTKKTTCELFNFESKINQCFPRQMMPLYCSKKEEQGQASFNCDPDIMYIINH